MARQRGLAKQGSSKTVKSGSGRGRTGRVSLSEKMNEISVARSARLESVVPLHEGP